MTEFQFCYWLMGVFELGTPDCLSKKQAVLIKEHLNLVTDRKHVFCNWLDGVFDSHGIEYMATDRTTKILNKLRAEFYFVIDRSYPKEQWNALFSAHEGTETPTKSQLEALC